jgi:hypothetical protein
LGINERSIATTPTADDVSVAAVDDRGICTSINVDVVKGRLMVMSRAAINDHVRLSFDHSDIRGDDIAISGD